MNLFSYSSGELALEIAMRVCRAKTEDEQTLILIKFFDAMKKSTLIGLKDDDRYIIRAAIQKASGAPSDWDNMAFSQKERASEIVKQIERQWLEERMRSS